MLRSSDQLYEVVSLSAELLPPLLDASRIVLEGLPATAESGRGPLLGNYRTQERHADVNVAFYVSAWILILCA